MRGDESHAVLRFGGVTPLLFCGSGQQNGCEVVGEEHVRCRVFGHRAATSRWRDKRKQVRAAAVTVFV